MSKIGLFVGVERGFQVLSALIANDRDISGVLILEQKNHEIENYASRLEKLCMDNNILYKKSSEVKSTDYKSYIESIDCDVLFVVSWRFLIPKECFSIPTHGIFVLHDSLLPKYRGWAPTNWVIINGEKETGLSLQYISEGMDAGDIVDQIKIKIDDAETAYTLNKKFLEIYPKIILDNVDSIINSTNKRTVQDENSASFGCKRGPEDGKIDFTLMSTQQITRLVRGLSFPYPGAFCHYRDREVIVWEVSEVSLPLNYVGRVPGRIVQINDEYVDVLTTDGVLRIMKISYADDPTYILKPKEILHTISSKLS